jgi:hypothetical protein
MEDLLQFMQDAGPDMVKVAVLAFTMACRELNATDTSSVIKGVIARRIIAYAQRGGRSAERLCRQTVEALLPRAMRAKITTPENERKITGENWFRVLEKAKVV